FFTLTGRRCARPLPASIEPALHPRPPDRFAVQRPRANRCLGETRRDPPERGRHRWRPALARLSGRLVRATVNPNHTCLSGHCQGVHSLTLTMCFSRSRTGTLLPIRSHEAAAFSTFGFVIG